MRDIKIAITSASYSGNKGAAAMLQSSIKALMQIYGEKIQFFLMSVYPSEDAKQIPFQSIKVVSCKPEQLMFIAFPLAIIYRLFIWLPLIKKLLCVNKIINAYNKTDLVIDEAGVSFVDSRGIIMNIYSFVQAATPMLIGVPVVKYSQALGEFNNIINRVLAKIVLPKIKLICARGEITFRNLNSIGIKKNVKICADGAFSMPDDLFWKNKIEQLYENDNFYRNRIIGLSLSSVVEKKCNELGIDYKKIMIDFINYLNDIGFSVLIIANAARIDSYKPRNNDLLVCNNVYNNLKNKDKNKWYNEEMTAEQIRELIAHCEVLIAARFHAMIGALEKSIPVLLVGWSHKYKEVLDMFGLGKYAIDYSNLSFDTLKLQFNLFIVEKTDISKKINNNIEIVKLNSEQNVQYISKIIDQVISKHNVKTLLDFNDSDRYIGDHMFCRKGYASDDNIRQVCSSGGIVTALLCYLLDTRQIEGAWITKSNIINGKLGYKTFVATTKEEIIDCASSIYMHMPLLSHIKEIMNFNGKIAVVMLPCQLEALSGLLNKHKEINEKIILRIGLFCGGNYNKNATMIPLKKKRINIDNAKRIIYKRGHWRGLTKILYNDCREISFSYTKNICAYKNAFLFLKDRCFWCQDHFAKNADISFGDIWLKEMKNNPIKHTACVVRTKIGKNMYNNAVLNDAIVDFHLGDEKVIASQKRALIFKYNCAKYKKNIYHKQEYRIKIDTRSKCKWNHKLAVILAYRNMKYSNKYPEKIEKIPRMFIFGYMLFIRTLLNW